MKRVAVIQSCYIPWRGFFDLIRRCDEYVIYDQVGYSKGHWHNRNRIKTAAGPRWLTIPVATSGRLGQPIDEVRVTGAWADGHFDQIRQAYRGATAFKSIEPWLREIYGQASRLELLSDINEVFLRRIAERLGIGTTITRDRVYKPSGARNQRLLETLVAAGATHYLSGPSAKAYLDEAIFKEAGITVEWMDYGPYGAYPQLHGPFDGQVSIVDVLLNGYEAVW